MKITNSKAFEYYNNLRKLKENNLILPGYISYAIIRNLKILEGLCEAYELAKSEILESKGTGRLDTETGLYLYDIPPEKVGETSNELKYLDNFENEVNFVMISLDSLIEAKDTIPLDTMDKLFFMIKGED